MSRQDELIQFLEALFTKENWQFITVWPHKTVGAHYQLRVIGPSREYKLRFDTYSPNDGLILAEIRVMTEVSIGEWPNLLEAFRAFVEHDSQMKFSDEGGVVNLILVPVNVNGSTIKNAITDLIHRVETLHLALNEVAHLIASS